MSHIVIEGGRRLEGTLTVQGAKNSVLPILAATILHPGRTVLRGCPRLSDVEASIRILRHLGCLAGWEGEELVVEASAFAKSVEILNEADDMLLEDNYFDMNAGEKRVRILKGKPEGLKIRSVFDIR